MHGLVQGSSGASGRANDQETEALKTTPVGMVREKRWAATATFLGGKRWMHRRDGTTKMAEGWAAL